MLTVRTKSMSTTRGVKMAAPFSPIGIDHVVFLVNDMDDVLRFYVDVMGCRPGYSYPALGMEQVGCGSSPSYCGIRRIPVASRSVASVKPAACRTNRDLATKLEHGPSSESLLTV